MDHQRYTQQQIFAIVSDVESYKEFIPWCVGSRLLGEDESSGLSGCKLAELTIGFQNIHLSYTSRVREIPYSALKVVGAGPQI